ncbi:hypothetical protein ACFYVR_16840 [Rhodococcus sp. NPDC003318]|uniref:hypothetical protein n=1 Tax=Rhodococcus sp. NPDC003318 TaxID=3364503 RepID=UPI00369415AD
MSRTVFTDDRVIDKLESATTAEEFLAELLAAGGQDVDASVSAAFAELTAESGLEQELEDAELQLSAQSTPVNMLASSMGARAAVPWCFTGRRATRYCS